MTDVNDIQIGGDHYKTEYQHWDFVCDLNLHYLLACATKYIYRWRTKNGIEDLRKASHYISKAIDRDIYHQLLYRLYIDKFTCQCSEKDDADIIDCIVYGRYDEASSLIQFLIEDHGKEATRDYVDQDKQEK